MYYEILGSTVRLAGSVHVVPEAAMLPSWVPDACAWSQDVYLEADSNEMKDHALLPPGETNKDKFPESVWNMMAAQWPAGAWFGPIGQQKIWFMNMVLSMAGVRVALGVEHFVNERLKERKGSALYLESVRDFARGLDALPDERLVQALILTAEFTVEQRTEKLAAMFEAWISGEPERVTTILQDSPLMLFPDIKRVVFDERNQAWMSKIKAAINQSRRTVILVGAGHLGGDAGLLALLTRAGHSVTPLLSS